MNDNNQQNNQNSNNVIQPQTVNLNAVQVNNNDTMLNRERDNIVSATIQANNNIDKQQAIEVNNELKTEKHPKYMCFVVLGTIIGLCIIAGVSIHFIIKSTEVPEVQPTTTTTTTTSQMDRFNSYLRNYSRVRKFSSDNYILILSTEGIDIKNNKEHYLLIHKSTEGIINSNSGTYTIENNIVKLDNNSYEYTEEGIKYENEVLKINDSEMKYYSYKDNDISYMLIINATSKNELAMFIVSNIDSTNVKLQSFTETDSSITLNDNTIFAKAEGNITYNNYTLTKAS